MATQTPQFYSLNVGSIIIFIYRPNFILGTHWIIISTFVLITVRWFADAYNKIVLLDDLFSQYSGAHQRDTPNASANGANLYQHLLSNMLHDAQRLNHWLLNRVELQLVAKIRNKFGHFYKT